MKPVILSFVISLTLLSSACSSGPKTVPIKIYSEPAGGYVIYRLDTKEKDDAPWIYLGTTPLESSLDFEKSVAREARKISFRIMKEGYFEINKDWQPEKIEAEIKQRNMLFWNPSLIKHNGQD